MSEFKSKILFLTGVIIFSIVLAYYHNEKKTVPIHMLSIYNSEGDTLLNLETKSENIKIWIGEDGKPEVWINQEEGGWIRK